QTDQPHYANLHRGVFLPDLLIAALDQQPDQPADYLDDRVLTSLEVRDEVSRYAQAYASLGITHGSPVAMLSLNRPEVLFAMGANMVTGCRTSALHPMGALDDHAYVLE